MRKIFLLGICLLMGWPAVLSQSKIHLSVKLNDNSNRFAKSLLRIQGKYANENLALNKLELKIYKLRQSGYLEANLDSLISNEDKLIGYVHIGNKYMITNFSHAGINQNDSLGLSFRYGKKNKLDFNEVKHFQQNIIENYNDKGYPFARIYNDSLRFDQSEIIGSWSLNKGKYVIWDSLKIKGNLKVRKEFLSKYLNIQISDPYSENDFNKISNRLRNLSFCKEIKPAEIEFVKNKAVLYTYIDKENSNRFDGILGLQSNEDGNENLSVTGEVNLLLNNAFRSGEQINLKWKKFNAESQDLSVSFSYPYLIGKTGADFNFLLSKQDSTYLSTNLKLGIRLFQKGNRHVKLFYNYHSSSLISTSHLSGISVLPEYADVKNHLVGLGFNHSNLDYPFNPKRGWKIEGEIGIGTHKIEKNRKIPEYLYDNIDLNSSLLNLEWNGEINLPLSNKISHRIRSMSGFLNSKNLFVNDLFKIGGLNSLRGFDEDSFRVSSYSIVTNELRFIPERNTSFYLFTDIAYYESEILDKTNDDFPIGVGFGLSFATKAGVFSLNYALGKQENQSFDLRNAKIHFGFISRF
jgi:outer membrane protein assembly factor BamA